MAKLTLVQAEKLLAKAGRSDLWTKWLEAEQNWIKALSTGKNRFEAQQARRQVDKDIFAAIGRRFWV